MSGRGRPGWWSPGTPARAVMLALAATPGVLPAVTAERLAGGAHPADLLGPHSPDPGEAAARLGSLGAYLLLPCDPGWPLAATPPDPPCAWLFVAGPPPPGPSGSVAVVGGRRASPLRCAAARSLGAGLAAAGWSVVSGGAVGVDAAAHQGVLDGGGRTVVVLGCGLDFAYPRANAGLFARVREEGGTLVTEHPPGVPPRPANFLPRNRLIAALAAAVVVVEAAEDSGSLSTARAAGARGSGRVLAVPGAPWDPGAAGCNALVRDGATLVRGLADILEELGPSTAAQDPPGPAAAPPSPPAGTSPPPAAAPSPSTGTSPAAAEATPGPGAAGPATAGAVVGPGGAAPAGRPRAPGGRAGRMVLAALVDGGVLGVPQLAATTGLAPPALAAALVELELAGLVRRTAAGAQAVALPDRTGRGA
jgi:DNA processing protein